MKVAAPPRVSVVVATRNRWPFLQQCVESVQSQQGVTWELIIVNDASTDQTRDWLDGMCSAKLRIHHFSTAVERCTARNRGLAMAQGEFVMFLDDDDWLWPDALQRLCAALDEHPAALAAIGARWDVFEGEGYERREIHPRRVVQRNIQDELLFGWSAVSGQNLYRSSVIRSIGGYRDESLVSCEDRVLWLRVAAWGEVVFIPQTVMSYRYHAGQIRPPDIGQIRDRVLRRAIHLLPRSRRRRALVLRQSGRMIEQAETQMSHGKLMNATWLACRAVINCPRIFASTLIGAWVLRRLAGRFYRRLVPVRGKILP